MAAKLRYSLERGARVELQEIAIRTPGRDLSLALDGTDRQVVLAAAVAIRAAEDGWVLLDRLAELASRPDRPVAAAAAASAAEIAARTDATLLERHEISGAELGALIQAWSALAAARHRWPDVRVHALEVSANLARASQLNAQLDPQLENGLGYDLGAMAADPEPEVRRAAFELLPRPLPDSARPIVARAVADDAEPVVALAAAQALCSRLGLAGSARPALDALGDAGLRRLRMLIVNPGLPPAALLDGARCIAADASPDSQAALRRLQKTGPASIRGLVSGLASGKP